MIRRAALVAAIAITSCGVAPLDMHHLAPVPHSLAVERWWREVEHCTGRTGDLATIRLTLWADTAMTFHGMPLEGAYLLDQRTIIVRSYDPRIIRHEMAHALLAPDTSHPAWVAASCGAILRWP